MQAEAPDFDGADRIVSGLGASYHRCEWPDGSLDSTHTPRLPPWVPAWTCTPSLWEDLLYPKARKFCCLSVRTSFDGTVARFFLRMGTPRVPKKIVPFPNRDKTFHETWEANRDWLDIPHPFRMLLASKPNGGKTTVILNIILRVALGKHPFRRLIVVHCDPKQTREYDMVERRLLADIPSPEELSGQEKTLVVLEDLNYLNMSQEQQGRLERLYGYASTHKNVSCILTAQDPFRILPTVRRCTNVFVLWNNHDQDMLKMLSRKTGTSSEQLLTLMEHECHGPHDSIWLDLTPDSPAPIRKNGYQRIRFVS